MRHQIQDSATGRLPLLLFEPNEQTERRTRLMAELDKLHQGNLIIAAMNLPEQIALNEFGQGLPTHEEGITVFLSLNASECPTAAFGGIRTGKGFSSYWS